MKVLTVLSFFMLFTFIDAFLRDKMILPAISVALELEPMKGELDPVCRRHPDDPLAVEVVVVALGMAGRAELAHGLGIYEKA